MSKEQVVVETKKTTINEWSFCCKDNNSCKLCEGESCSGNLTFAGSRQNKNDWGPWMTFGRGSCRNGIAENYKETMDPSTFCCPSTG